MATDVTTNEVSIQAEDFDIAALHQALASQASAEAGAVACFTGLVRAHNEGRPVRHIDIEHYPGMTERSIRDILQQARQRWALLAVKVVHRVGRLGPGERIVFVGASSAHRGDALRACEFIMDYLKTRAPFWKQEHGPDGARWVEARASDTRAAARWRDES